MCPRCAPVVFTSRCEAGQTDGRGVSRPVGRVLCPAYAGRRSSIWDCRCRQPRAVYPRASGGQPSSTRAGRLPKPNALLTLLRVGFTKPPQSPAALVVSYTTVSPLPCAHPGAVCFLWHFPAGHPGSALPTTLPCGGRTLL